MEITIINQNDVPVVIAPENVHGFQLKNFVTKHRAKIRKAKQDIKEGKYNKITFKDK